jgi:hypothetical protein
MHFVALSEFCEFLQESALFGGVFATTLPHFEPNFEPKLLRRFPGVRLSVML